MRTPVLLAASLSLSACAEKPGAADFAYRATFDKRTRGLVLHQDGEKGHAGMFGTNCPFETRNGTVTGDYDLPGSDEEIQDGEPTELGEISLAAVMPDVVHVIDKTDDEYSHVSVSIAGVREARLLFDGVVGITDDCTLSWVGLDGALRQQASVGACAGDIEADPLSGLVIVGDPDSAVVTDGEGSLQAERSGDLVAFDPVAEAFYIARTGEAWLAALELDGAERWLVETPGVVTALDDGGEVGAAAVVLELEDGSGAVAFYDGRTGERVRYAETPSAADDLSVSGDGAVIALVRTDQSFFYELVE